MMAERFHYHHPTMIAGTLHFEDEAYEVIDGVVECPTSIATDVDGKVWLRASDEVVAARQSAPGTEDPLVKILDGTVAEVTEALEQPFEGVLLTVAQLEALAQLEASRANRKGVQAAIADRVEAVKASA